MTWPLPTGAHPSGDHPSDKWHDDPGVGLASASGAPTSQDFRGVHRPRIQQGPSCVGYTTGTAIQDWDLRLHELDAQVQVMRPDGSTFRTNRQSFAPLDDLSCAWYWTNARIIALNALGVGVTKDLGLPVGGSSYRYNIQAARDCMARAEADWPDAPARFTYVPDALAEQGEPLVALIDGQYYRIRFTSEDDMLAALSVALDNFGKGLGSKPGFCMPVGAGYASTPPDGVYQRVPTDKDGHAQLIGAVDIAKRLVFAHWTWEGSAGCWIRIEDFMAVASEAWVFTGMIYMQKVQPKA